MRSLIAAWLIICVAVAFVSSQLTRIVAMGDLHGDLKNTLTILRFANLVDADGHWAGNDTIFVQTGDVLDRGLDTIKLYDLIQQLREEAEEAGGKVIPLFGNHEIQNLKGDWRYVNPKEVETFGGMDERIKAFRPDGFIGSYLMPLNMTTKVGRTVFCHGGIHPDFARNGLDWINDQTHEELLRYIESHGHQDPHGVFGGNGPTWYRGYALDDEATVCPLLDEALTLLEADRMVLGHTVQRDGKIHTRCNGKVVLIDIGISYVYGGHRGVLEIKGDHITAIYEHGRTPLNTPTHKKHPIHDEF
ncbi:hypothetical protein DFQ28_009105 [Apophysomyces sp. BC1034]|nr:hypothetical protein DFQ30_008844 [Apophysomyces sp. BC1015]KAG0173740.1 hypothetical protein DFQ29_007770 [Apophysomyces sp. BC1021]KAG0185592.1 hypothetical protein DFQ28_009105 [Apophysomyces sp. BC1034]